MQSVRDVGHARLFVSPGGISRARRAPVPLEAALEHNSGSAASQIESDTEVDAKLRLNLPVTAREQLVRLGLSARTDVDTLYRSIVFE